MSKIKNMKLRYKIGVGVASTAALVGVAGGAFAYFTDTGNGTGSATVGSSSHWSVGQTATSTAKLYPDASIGGANIATNSYTVQNVGNGSQNLTQVVISIANSDGSAWTAVPGCSASDFSVGGAAVGTAWTDTSAAGDFTANQSKTKTVTVEMIDNGGKQDSCQGVTVPLYYSAS